MVYCRIDVFNNIGFLYFLDLAFARTVTLCTAANKVVP